MRSKQIERVCKVTRRGKSLGVRLPREIVDHLRLAEGDRVNVRVSADAITLHRAKPRKRWRETDLLKGVNPAMCGPDPTPVASAERSCDRKSGRSPAQNT